MKQYQRYQMDYESPWVRRSAICAGAAMLVLAFYYLGLQYLESAGSLWIPLWMPLVIGFAYLFLLCGIRLNAPGALAIVGCFMCLWLMIGLFSGGSMVRIVLGVIAYLLSGAVLILAAGGFLPGRLPAAVCFALVLAVRVIFFDLGKVSGLAWLPEIGNLGFIAALMCLPMAMVPGKKAKGIKESKKV